jgi:hypothetical protein
LAGAYNESKLRFHDLSGDQFVAQHYPAMPLPNPQYPLEGACSVIFDNTLFTYSQDAFQSLELKQDAEWVTLPMGEAVKRGVCVTSTPANDAGAAALYVVGGSGNSSDYEGLQRYTFASKRWETIRPTVPVTQNRLYHGAVYLNASDSILVYAGTQDGSMQPSSQTFTIQATEPYAVLAYEAIAPPAIDPLLMQWTESNAIYIGGSNTNTKAMIFSPTNSWTDSNSTLADPLYNTSAIKSIVVNGDDASKTLYTFDMTVAPNAVNRTILVDGNGNPVQSAKPIASRGFVDRSNSLEKRDGKGNLTVADWPAYNDTFVPLTTRSSYSVAKDQSGLVVISGGNETDVLCMFKARDNCWENATAKLVSKSTSQQGLGLTPSTTLPSSSETPSSSAAAAATDSPKSQFPVKILVAVLCSIIGAAIILLAVLLLFRWRWKRKQYSDAGHQRRSSGIPNEKDTVEFSNRGLPQMSSTRQFHNHEPQNSQGSFSSMAILMGRVGHKRGGNGGNGSLGSDTSSQFNKKYKTAISNPIPQEQPYPAFAGSSQPIRNEVALGSQEERGFAPKTRGSTRGGRRGSTRRSSGWGKYWSGGSALLGFGTKRTTYGSDADSDSQYSENNRLPSQVTQTSAIVPPLKLAGQPELNRVASGSPTVNNTSTRFPLTREMSGQIERPGSTSSDSSYNDDDRRDAFSSGVPASVHEQSSWTPVDRQDWGPGRAPSNAYTESVYATTLPRSTVANFPRNTQFPAPPSSQRQPPQQDMSWLNLGGDSSGNVSRV